MNVQTTETFSYYQSLNSDQLCSCAYCRNYRRNIRTAYPAVAAWLDTLGVDIEKPLETSPLEPDDHGFLEYCGGQYILFGDCEDGFLYQIEDVEFRKAQSHPGTGIRKPHFVLEFFPIRLKADNDLFRPHKKGKV